MSKANETIIYCVDNGICSVDKVTGAIYHRNGSLYIPRDGNDGYLEITLKAPQYQAQSIYVHRIVAYAIYGIVALSEDVEIDHKNRNRRDYTPSNLRVISKHSNRSREKWYGTLRYIVTNNDGDIIACFLTEDMAISYITNGYGSNIIYL
jgi:HNH endonuclease